MDEIRKKLIGSRIREERKLNNLSQDELAEKLGMKRANISNYEAGRTVPPGSALLEMSKIFSVTTDYLLGLSNDANTSIPVDENLMQIQRAKRKLDEKEQSRMNQMLEMVKLSFHDAFNDTEEEEEGDDDL